MTTATAQPDQNQFFKDRFDSADVHNIRHVSDAIGLMKERAEGILFMVIAFMNSKEKHYECYVESAIYGAISEINDMMSVINGHAAAIYSTQQAILPQKKQTDEQAQFTEVQRWADYHLLATDNKYRLIESATMEVLAEFKAESLEAANTISGLFLRGGAS